SVRSTSGSSRRWRRQRAPSARSSCSRSTARPSTTPACSPRCARPGSSRARAAWSCLPEGPKARPRTQRFSLDDLKKCAGDIPSGKAQAPHLEEGDYVLTRRTAPAENWELGRLEAVVEDRFTPYLVRTFIGGRRWAQHTTRWRSEELWPLTAEAVEALLAA